MWARINSTSALRALVLQNLFWEQRVDIGWQIVWSMVRGAYWGRGWWQSSFKRKMNVCSMTFQNISALRTLGAMLGKMPISSEENTFTLKEAFQHIWKCSALRAVGGDVDIFRTKFLGVDRDEKVDVRRITSHAPWCFKQNFWGRSWRKDRF